MEIRIVADYQLMSDMEGRKWMTDTLKVAVMAGQINRFKVTGCYRGILPDIQLVTFTVDVDVDDALSYKQVKQWVDQLLNGRVIPDTDVSVRLLSPVVPLPTDEDGHIRTSAEYGEQTLVKIWWTTDYDGRDIDPGKEEYPETLHGPFHSLDEAKAWMDAYPEFTEIHDIVTVPLNLVRPS